MAKLNYQMVCSTEYKDGHVNDWKQSYGSLEKAIEATRELVWNESVHAARTVKVVFKPTGETLRKVTW